MNLGSSESPRDADPRDADPSDPGARLAALIGAAAVAGSFPAQGLWAPRAAAKGAVLFAQGDSDGDVRVLTRGLVKLVYLTPQGDERIKSFVADAGVFAPRGLADGPGPSPYSAICLEPSEIARLPAPALRAAIARDPALREAAADFTLWVLRRKQAREAALLCDSAEDRYLSFLADAPGLARRLPQGEVARFLGITPVAFSRIRRRLRGQVALPG